MNDDNSNKDINEEITENLSESIEKNTQKGLSKAMKKIGKLAFKAIMSGIKLLLPYLLILGIILLIAVLGYFILFEFIGTEKEFTKEYENPSTKNENGIYITDESQINMQNKTVRDFYRYFAGKSIWKLKGKDNEKFISSDDDEEIEDYYKREEMFKLSPDLLYSLDEYMFNWKWKYPEQFIKPVYFDKEKLELKQLTDENNMVTAKSEEEDIKTGEKTGKKITSVRDYGLGSILKYNEKEDYKRTLKVKGEYVSEDVWDEATKSVKTVKIEKPIPFELEMKPPEPIWIIDRAILFTGEIEFEYKYKQEKYDDLITGATDKENEPKTEFIYDVHYEPNCETKTRINSETGVTEEYQVCGEPTRYELKRYRSEDSAIFEELPVVSNTITKDEGQKYFYDYLYNFESYIPTDVIEKFNFEDRIDYDSSIFDYKAILSDDYGFDLGSGLDTKRFKSASKYFDIVKKHSADFGVDPYIMLAIMTQESGGNADVNSNGLMQITGSGDKTITAKNVYGEEETFTIKKHERQDPDKAIKYAVMHFKCLLEMMDNNPYKAIQAYNFGTGTMSTIKELDPEAWESKFGWLIYREKARRERAPAGKASASYGCMAFPEGTLSHISGNLWGDSCYLENVLRYYAGNDIEKINTEGNSIWDKLKVLGNAFMKFLPQRKKDELVPKINFINNAKENRISDILITAKALDNGTLFSETVIEDSLELSFWDKGFMDSIGSAGLSLQDIMNIAPNSEGYLPPIVLGNGVEVTSYFGPRVKPIAGASTWHKGVDIGAPVGTPIYAIASGEVEDTGWQKSTGNFIKINHGNGIESCYFHLSAIFVKKGDMVTQGQNIGAVGSTGISTGPHLHFEFRKNGKAIDPIGIVTGGKKT